MRRQDCPHTAMIDDDARPATRQCEACGLARPIRMCATCGYVGCCESRGAHDTQHYEATGHPVIKEMPLAETSFTWCYACGDYLE